MRRKETEAEWFIRQVAEGDSALDSSAIERLSGQMGISFGSKGCFCVVVKYMEQSAITSDVSMPIALYNSCVLASGGHANNVYCYTGAHLYVVMVIADADGNRAERIEKLYRKISRHSPAMVQMGVGRCYQNVEKLSYSKVEAYEALHTMGKNAKISYIDDIYVTRNITTHKLGREKRKIIELFKAGEMEQLRTNAVHLIENVRAESPVREDRPYPSSIRRTILELLFEIMHISADAGVDVDEVLNYQDPYSKVFEMGSTPDILAWFFDMAKLLSDHISELNSTTENNMLTLAKKSIDEYISEPELSLSLISDELGITPAYFSAFFIREVGVGFNEYITCLRIERAKMLLTTTNMKINLIASQCGFRSSSYFIVVFRKQTGMSPGEYRNKK